jgi:hypothetical protein
MKKKTKPVKKKVMAKKKPGRSPGRSAKKISGKGTATKKMAVAKKKAAKGTARPAAKRKADRPIGTVTHFYNEIGVAIVRFKEKVPLGTVLHFRGATTDFKHPVRSMQYDHEPIRVAPKGKQIGIKVPKRVRVGDNVHRG